MSDCNHDCSHCDSKCENEIKFDQPHKDSHIKKVIGVVSGKGGVGKSLVTGLLASKFSRPVSYTHLTLPTTPYV